MIDDYENAKFSYSVRPNLVTYNVNYSVFVNFGYDLYFILFFSNFWKKISRVAM